MSKKMDKLNAEWMALVSKVLERHEERISALEEKPQPNWEKPKWWTLEDEQAVRSFMAKHYPSPKVAEPPVRDRSEHMLPVQHVEAQHLQKGDVEGGNKRVVKNVTKLYEITYDDGTRILRGPTQWHYIECRDKETKQ